VGQASCLSIAAKKLREIYLPDTAGWKPAPLTSAIPTSEFGLNATCVNKSGVALRLSPQSKTQVISENEKPLPVLPEGACVPT
jgi:hypothetical protein